MYEINTSLSLFSPDCGVRFQYPEIFGWGEISDRGADCGKQEQTENDNNADTREQVLQGSCV